MTTPLQVSEEAERNLQRLRETRQPIPEACLLISTMLATVSHTLGLIGLAHATGSRDPQNIEALRVVANQFRRCADMLDLASDRQEKENL